MALPEDAAAEVAEATCGKCGAARGAYQYCINCGHDSRIKVEPPTLTAERPPPARRRAGGHAGPRPPVASADPASAAPATDAFASPKAKELAEQLAAALVVGPDSPGGLGAGDGASRPTPTKPVAGPPAVPGPGRATATVAGPSSSTATLVERTQPRVAGHRLEPVPRRPAPGARGHVARPAGPAGTGRRFQLVSAAVIVVGVVAASAWWFANHSPDDAEGSARFTCWDGSDAAKLSACGGPFGAKGMTWVFPDSQGEACASTVNAGAEQAWRCEVDTTAGPATLVYSGFTSVAAGITNYDELYADGAGQRALKNDRYLWRPARRTPQGRWQRSAMYAEYPWSVHVESAKKRAVNRAFKQIRFRDPGQMRGVSAERSTQSG
ncbi:MAG: hypothetical protein ACRCYQ_05205 [Nocardioides sp.]